MIKSAVLFLSSVGLLGAVTPAHGACLKYEPDTVTLRGTIERKTFSDSPTFKPDSGRALLLLLDAPICVDVSTGASLEDHANTAVVGARELTLVSGNAPDAVLAALKPGTHVEVTGTLWRTATGHFMTDLAITVANVQSSNQRLERPVTPPLDAP